MPSVKLGFDSARAVAGMEEFRRSIIPAIQETERLDKSITKTEKDLAFFNKTMEKAAKGANLGRTSRSAARGVNELGQSLNQLARIGSLAIGPLSGVGARLRALGGILGAGGFGAIGIIGGISGLVAGLYQVAKAGAAFEKDFTRIDAIVKTTGSSAGLTARKINEIAEALGRNTLASAGGARQAAATLLTFKSLGGEDFERALKASQDLSELGFGGLQENAVRLAKAIEDPATQLTFLKRSGISFLESEKELIVALQEAGKEHEATSKILDIIERQSKGVAEAVGRSTLAGAWDSLTEAIGRFAEKADKAIGLTGALRTIFQTGAYVVDDTTTLLFPSLDEEIKATIKEIAILKAEIASIEKKGISGRGVRRTKILERQELDDRLLELNRQKRQQDREDEAAGKSGLDQAEIRKIEKLTLGAKNLKLELDNAFKDQEDLDAYLKKIRDLNTAINAETGKPFLSDEEARALEKLARDKTDKAGVRSRKKDEDDAAKLLKQQQEAIRVANEEIDIQRLKVILAGESEEAIANSAKTQAFLNKLVKAQVVGAQDLADEYREVLDAALEIEQTAERQEAFDKAKTDLQSRTELLQVENALIEDNAVLAKVEVEVLKERQSLREDGIEGLDEELRLYREVLLTNEQIKEQIKEQERAQKEATKEVEKFANTVEDILTGAFKGAVREFIGEMNAAQSIIFDIVAELGEGIAKKAFIGPVSDVLAGSLGNIPGVFSSIVSGKFAPGASATAGGLTSEELETLRGIEGISEESLAIMGLQEETLANIADTSKKQLGVAEDSLKAISSNTESLSKVGAGAEGLGSIGSSIGGILSIASIGLAGYSLFAQGQKSGNEYTTGIGAGLAGGAIYGATIGIGAGALAASTGATIGGAIAFGAATGAAYAGIGAIVGIAIGAIYGAIAANQNSRHRITANTFTTDDPNSPYFFGSTESQQQSPFGYVGLSGSKRLKAPIEFIRGITDFDFGIRTLLNDREAEILTEEIQAVGQILTSSKNFNVAHIRNILKERISPGLERILLEETDLPITERPVSEIVDAINSNDPHNPENLFKGVQTFFEEFRSLESGLFALNGGVVTEAEKSLGELNDVFTSLLGLANKYGVALDVVNEAYADGLARFKSESVRQLDLSTLSIADPFLSAIIEIIEGEKKLLAESEALGVGFSSVASLVATQRAALLQTTLEPVNNLLNQIQFDRTGPLQSLDLLESMFQEVLQGTDANSVAQLGSQLLEMAQATFGRTDLFFEREALVESSLEEFGAKLTEQVFSTADAVEAQTVALIANQEEQTQLLVSTVSELSGIRSELIQQREEISLLLAKVA